MIDIVNKKIAEMNPRLFFKGVVSLSYSCLFPALGWTIGIIVSRSHSWLASSPAPSANALSLVLKGHGFIRATNVGNMPGFSP
jgi:hypothetical protein